jgi:hypothetical protein
MQKMMMSLKAWLEVFLLLLPFVCFEDLQGVLGMLRLAISVCDSDIHDAICCMGS